MKVALVCPYDMARPGGVQDQVVRLAAWLRATGRDASIVAPGEYDDPGFITVGSATVIPANGAATPVALSPRVARRVAEAIDEFDVVHIHEPLMPQVSLAALRHGRRPLVGTFHADVSPPADLAYRCGRPIVRRWLRRLSVITAVSPIAARVVEYTRRVRIIPNGIDVGSYVTGDKHPGSVVFLGRNDERKGLPLLLDAWKEIREAHPEATLAVVGAEGPSDATRGITFTGRVSEEEKRRYLGSAVVYCAPNLGGESFGIVVAEAMAAGCAVVASGLPAFVGVAGDAAVYTAPGYPHGLAAAINDLLDHPGRADAMGRAARRRVRRFDGTEVAAAYLAAYEESLTTASGTGSA
jgi:phosphatidylinositol alpha-mannosyltransferase